MCVSTFYLVFVGIKTLRELVTTLILFNYCRDGFINLKSAFLASFSKTTSIFSKSLPTRAHPRVIDKSSWIHQKVAWDLECMGSQ